VFIFNALYTFNHSVRLYLTLLFIFFNATTLWERERRNNCNGNGRGGISSVPNRMHLSSSTEELYQLLRAGGASFVLLLADFLLVLMLYLTLLTLELQYFMCEFVCSYFVCEFVSSYFVCEFMYCFMC
jgi:hypothetical protein